MIVYGTYKDKKDCLGYALEELECSGRTFYLAGSRYCGDAIVSSDWDFYVKGNTDWYRNIGMFLHNLGFGLTHKEGQTHRDNEYSTDDGTRAVYEKMCIDGKIQISIVKDLQIKVAMYRLAMERGWDKTKRGCTDNWNALYKEVTEKD